MKIKRAVKFFVQKVFRGWCDADTWNLDYKIAEFVLPRLKRHKQVSNGYPPTVSVEEWNEILDKMIWSFEFLLADEETELYPTRSVEELFDKEEEGFRLFGEYFRNLWW